MTGPEHYQEAERLIRVLTVAAGGGRVISAAINPNVAAVAQVHATLALAAATALTDPTHLDTRAWARAAGESEYPEDME